MAHEIEAKILNIEPDEVRQRLADAGATLETERYKQSRYVFDIVKGDQSKWIRLRTTEKGTTLTVKQVVSDEIDGTEEYETRVEDEAETLKMLELMGFTPKSYQENYREAYELDSAEVTIDWWPKIPPYIEIEGETEEIVKNVADRLGYNALQLTSRNTKKIYWEDYNIDLDSIDRLTFDETDHVSS